MRDEQPAQRAEPQRPAPPPRESLAARAEARRGVAVLAPLLAFGRTAAGRWFPRPVVVVAAVVLGGARGLVGVGRGCVAGGLHDRSIATAAGARESGRC